MEKWRLLLFIMITSFAAFLVIVSISAMYAPYTYTGVTYGPLENHIKNPSFETGSYGPYWITAGGSKWTIGTDHAGTGSYCAKRGSYAANMSDWVRQNITDVGLGLNTSNVTEFSFYTRTVSGTTGTIQFTVNYTDGTSNAVNKTAPGGAFVQWDITSILTANKTIFSIEFLIAGPTFPSMTVSEVDNVTLNGYTAVLGPQVVPTSIVGESTVMFAIGLFGCCLMIVGPVYLVENVLEGEYLKGLGYGFIFTFLGFILIIGWLFG